MMSATPPHHRSRTPTYSHMPSAGSVANKPLRMAQSSKASVASSNVNFNFQSSPPYDDGASYRSSPVHEKGERFDDRDLRRQNSTTKLRQPTMTQMTRSDHETQHGRSAKDNLDAIITDLFVTLLSTLFIVFCVLCFKWDKRPADDQASRALMESSRVGVTIFPIIFTIILAKLVKAVAAWRLEDGATIGFLAYLLGSRSLVAAFTAPLKYRTCNMFAPLLVVLWALSPIGGQSTLRAITIEPLFTNDTQVVQYLNLSSSPFVVSNTSTAYLSQINAAFNAALTGPASSKNGTQDLYGNVQIPMLQALPSTLDADQDGWFNTTDKSNITYTAFLGIPMLNVTDNANATFSIETTYFNVDCNVTSQSGSNEFSLQSPDRRYQSYTNTDFGIWANATHNATATQDLSLGFRSLGVDSNGDSLATAATCTLSTTYLESMVYCNGTRSCNVISIRESKTKHNSTSVSALDGVTVPSGRPQNQTIPRFFSAFIDSTGSNLSATSPIQTYFLNPSDPFSPLSSTAIAPIGSILFSRRFAQLLNTYWLCGIAPTAMLGTFQNNTTPFSTDSILQYQLATSNTGLRVTSILAIKTHAPWLILLLISSILMLAAGLLATVLTALRTTPDILGEGYVAALTTGPYLKVPQGSSMEDSVDKVLRLQETVIRIGDVKASEGVGYVAVATPGNQIRVAKVQSDRRYL